MEYLHRKLCSFHSLSTINCLRIAPIPFWGNNNERERKEKIIGISKTFHFVTFSTDISRELCTVTAV